MNNSQRVVLAIGTVAIAANILYPPFQFVGDFTSNAGYHFLLTPPTPSVTSNMKAVVSASLLFMQYLTVLTITGIGFLLAGPHKPSS